MEIMSVLMNILPDPPTGTPSELAESGLEFFGLWIGRIGGLIAFIGAVKFALSIKADDAKEQLQSVLTMVSGFMIQAAISDIGIFNIPSTYTSTDADLEFQSIMNFIGSWTGRVGALAAFIGAIMFGLAIRSNEASLKVSGLKTIAAGGIVMSVSALLSTFV